MKKVLFISPLPPPHYGSAISSKMCLDILKTEKRFDIRNIKLNSSSNISEVGKVSFKKLLGFLNILFQLIKHVTQFRPEIIYFMPATRGFTLIRDYVLIKIIKTFSRKKIILHVRTQLKKGDWHSPFKKYVLKDLFNCDKIIILGLELIDGFNGEIEKNKFYVLPNAIPNTLSNKKFDEIIKNRKCNNTLTLLFLSNLEKAKGWFKTLEACKLLSELELIYECHFVGDWRSKTEKLEFINFVERYNLSNNIICHGEKIGKEKDEILAMSDILIFPTENEAFGRVVIEAMEYGIPVISSNVGAIPSIIEHGITGFIMEENKPSEIVKYVLQLQNVDYRFKMGIESRARFQKKFTIETFKYDFINIINKD